MMKHVKILNGINYNNIVGNKKMTSLKRRGMKSGACGGCVSRYTNLSDYGCCTACPIQQPMLCPECCDCNNVMPCPGPMPGPSPSPAPMPRPMHGYGPPRPTC